MQTVHVIMNQQDLDPARLPGKVAVVFDVLFATTTIAMALHEGADEVVPVPEVEDARRLGGDNTILAGEKDAAIPEGFETFTPIGLSRAPLKGKRLVLVTTNGTVALHNAREASHVYTAALVNATAMAQHLLRSHSEETILLVCAASRHRFNIEDFAGAGAVANLLKKAAPSRFQLTDAAEAAMRLARDNNLFHLLSESRVGRLVESLDLAPNTELSARMDHYPVVPRLEKGALRCTT